MLSDETTNILPVGAGFAPETGSVRNIPNRELLAFEHRPTGTIGLAAPIVAFATSATRATGEPN